MKSFNPTSPDKALPETVLVDFARHLRTTHFLIVFAAIFLIVVSFQLPISPIEKSIHHIERIKELQKIALPDSPTSKANILGLIIARKLKLTPSHGTESLPLHSLVTHNEQTLSIKWQTVFPLVETTLSSRSKDVLLKSISQLPLHSLQTFDNFRQLWDLHHRQFPVHIPIVIANRVLVIDQPNPDKQPSANIRDLQTKKTLLGIQSNKLLFEKAVFIEDFDQSHFPYVLFSTKVVADYMQKTAGHYNIALVFQAESPDIRNPTKLVVPISTQRIQIQAQLEISSLANASWSEGPFGKSFSELQAIMPKIKDKIIVAFDIDLVRRVYPNESKVEQQKINILGMTINGIQMLSWGPWLILAIQLYFYILCRQFYQINSNSRRALVFPWIGLSRDTIGRVVYFISIILLPVLALFISIGALQYSPISQYQVLTYLRYVAVIIASLTARIIIFEDWRQSGRAEIRRELS